jgi:hypothetical protein
MNKLYEHVCKIALMIKIIEKSTIEYFRERRSPNGPAISAPRKQPTSIIPTIEPETELVNEPRARLAVPPNARRKSDIVRTPDITPVSYPKRRPPIAAKLPVK